MTCQSRCLDCNKCPTLEGTSVVRKSVRGGEGYMGISAPSSQFFHELKAALKKNQSILKREEEEKGKEVDSAGNCSQVSKIPIFPLFERR